MMMCIVENELHDTVLCLHNKRAKNRKQDLYTSASVLQCTMKRIVSGTFSIAAAIHHMYTIYVDPTVEFESAGYTVQAPDYQEECSDLFVAVVRNNDINYSSSTICYSTIDDTAVAGEDYYESRGTLHFAVGEQRKVIPIQLCSHHLPTNKTKRFHVHIAEGNNSTRVVGPSDIEVLIVGREPIVPFFHEETLIMSSNHELVQPGVHYNITGENFLLCVTVRHYRDPCTLRL